MPTYKNSDSLEVYEDKYDINPTLVAQPKYNSNGSLTAWFINKQVEKVSKHDGKWNLKNDSLFVAFLYNNKQNKVWCHISKTEEGFLSKSTNDWNNDE